MTRNEFVIAAALLALNAGQNVILVTPRKPVITAEDLAAVMKEAETFDERPKLSETLQVRLTEQGTPFFGGYADAYDPYDIHGVPYVDGDEIKRGTPKLLTQFEADQVVILDEAHNAMPTIRDYLLKNKDRGRLVLIFRDTYGLDAFNDFPGLRLTLNPEYTVQ